MEYKALALLNSYVKSVGIGKIAILLNGGKNA
jgi:hypothetical protein